MRSFITGLVGIIGLATATSAMVTGRASTASIAHPDNGKVPPQNAIIVSQNSKDSASFSSISAALASLPNDNTDQTVFVNTGSYNEQLPAINRPGGVRIIGYTTGNPGQSYKDNTVRIQFSRGLSVSPLPAGHNDAETAVVSTASSRISFYNINFVNTDNLDGSKASYVTLAASIYGNRVAFYACSLDGWQDTLLTGATAGYLYFESCYLGGAIDFICTYPGTPKEHQERSVVSGLR
jgi:pectin methylesterase-like acyl-CoA thioesterase